MSSAKASEAASLATSTQPSSPPPPPPPLNGDSSNRTAGKPSDNHELTLPERARSQNENEEKPARNPDDGDIDADEDEDEEDMGTKAKALSKLLQTSSVSFSGIFYPILFYATTSRGYLTGKCTG